MRAFALGAGGVGTRAFFLATVGDASNGLRSLLPGTARLVSLSHEHATTREVATMGFLDRLLGRTKKAAGDITDNAELRREGAHQEAEGAAKDRAERLEDAAGEARERATEHRIERENT